MFGFHLSAGPTHQLQWNVTLNQCSPKMGAALLEGAVNSSIQATKKKKNRADYKHVFFGFIS
jgi:hypothetical protein